MRKGIAVAAVVLIVALFVAVITTITIKRDSADANQLNQKNAAVVNASNSTQTQFVYGSKKKLMSDF